MRGRRGERWSRPLSACGALVLLASCSPASTPPTDEWQVERETQGNTTIVRTLAGSAWGAPRQMVEDLVIGTAEGPDETMFGGILTMTPDGTGGIYAYDYQVPAIRHFDAKGGYLAQVGREGEGPGEYLDAVLGMAVRADGRLQIWDTRNRRVTIYEPHGAYSEDWSVQSGLFTSQALFLDTIDHTYIKYLEEQPTAGEEWKIGLLRFDASGAPLDPIGDPEVADPPSGSDALMRPTKVWTFGRDGAIVVGVNSSYEFEIRASGGNVVRVQRVAEPLAVGDAEHAAYEVRREFMNRTQGQFMTELLGETPRHKPFYRSLATDEAGRVWVQRYAPVEPKSDVEPPQEGRPPPWPFSEPKVFDVFEPDGTYLGQVRGPDSVEFHHFGLDELWGVRTGANGEFYIVRMHLEPAALAR